MRDLSSQNVVDPCMYVKFAPPDKYTAIASYTDEYLIATTILDGTVCMKKLLSSRFEMEDLR